MFRSLEIIKEMFMFRFSDDLDRVKKGAVEALAKHQTGQRAGKEMKLVDPMVHWVEIQSLCGGGPAQHPCHQCTI